MAQKIKNLSTAFFYIFLFLLPWQTRFIFTPDEPEFLTFSIYLSEIFLWLALAFWLTSADLKRVRLPRVLMFLCFYVLVSFLWSSDRVAAFRLWLFVFDGMMAYLFLREHSEMKKRAADIFLFSLFISAIFGIWQFFNLGSPAEKWLGLAARGAWNLGDIVIEAGHSTGSGLGGGRWLRAYGSFPHPNIFGGYLAAGILMLAARKSHKYLLYILGGIFLFALFLTFSRSTWIGLSVAGIYFLIKNYNRRILKYFCFLFLMAAILSITFWPFVKTRASSAGRLEEKSNMERVASWKDGLAVWLENPIFGAGAGNYLTKYEIQNQKSEINLKFKIQNSKSQQPPHNIFILILSQLGLVGFAIYLFLWRQFWKNPAVRPLIILFFVIGLFDHYLWTLYSGQALFWVSLGLVQND